MMKKIFAAATISGLLMMGSVMTAFSAESDFEYFISDGEVQITAVKDGVSIVNIPDQIEGMPVTGIDSKALRNSDDIIEVRIPASVKQIDPKLFEDNDEITAITVAKGHEVFAEIDGVLFEKKTKKLVAYPRGRKESSYTVPSGIKEIGDQAFHICTNLEEISLPDSVTTIGEQAFSVTALSEITIPGSVSYIGSDAFRACSSLTKIDVAPENETYASVVDVLFDKKKKAIHTYPAAKQGSEYTVPKGIKEIGANAFAYSKNLTKIVAPESVERIGEAAFYCSKSLTEFDVPKAVTEIEDYTFAECWKLEKITIPETVSAIGEKAFAGDENEVLVVITGSYAYKYAKDNNLYYKATAGEDTVKEQKEETDKKSEKTEKVEKKDKSKKKKKKEKKAAEKPTKKYLEGPNERLMDESGVVPTLNWEEVKQEYQDGTESEKACLNGRFVTFDDYSLKIFVPDMLEEMALSEQEQVDGGMTTTYINQDSDFILYVYAENCGDSDLVVDMMEEIAKECDSPLYQYVVNGLTSANLMYSEDGYVARVSMFGSQDGDLVVFSFLSEDVSLYEDEAYLMLSSVQTVE